MSTLKTKPSFFPPSLKPGGTIGIVSPASWLKPAILAEAKKTLEKCGYKVVVHPQNHLRDGRLAGNDKARAKAIMDMFNDPKIDAVLCARGGVGGSMRLIDHLDFKRIAKNPKPFIGFSDVTFLLQAISKKCGFVTYHGPASSWLTGERNPKTLNDFLTVVGSKKKTIELNFVKTKTLRAGKAKGKLIGGNLTLLQDLIATDYDWSGKDTILFIEDVDEALYKIDRMLQHFRLAGKLKGLCAVLVGEMVAMTDGETPAEKYGKSLEQIIMDVLPRDIPVCMDFPCGHSNYLTTLPVGAAVEVNIGKNNTKLSFKPS